MYCNTQLQVLKIKLQLFQETTKTFYFQRASVEIINDISNLSYNTKNRGKKQTSGHNKKFLIIRNPNTVIHHDLNKLGLHIVDRGLSNTEFMGYIFNCIPFINIVI